ncbi:MAG: tetratricopeptide repeat protein [Flavobacteriales bacterium]|nr:tetratricopeptide repeat protein [Flavobacteriales bacterium]
MQYVRHIVLGLVLLVNPQVRGDGSLDSLRACWDARKWKPGSAPDTALVRLANELSRIYQYQGNADSALWFARTATGMASDGASDSNAGHRGEWLPLLMAAQRASAAQLFFLGRYPESIEAVKAYLTTAEELQLPEEVGAGYNYLSYCYLAMEDLSSALHWSRKAMEVMRGIGNGPDLANAYTGLGNILDELGQRDSAMIYMRKALELHRFMDHPNNHAATLFSAIETLLRSGTRDSVDAYLARAKVLVDRLGEPRPTMNYLNLLGQQELEKGMSLQAVEHLLHADSLAIVLEDHRSRHYINRALALAYAAAGRSKDARERADVADEELMTDLGLEKVRAVAAEQARAQQDKQLATAEAKADALRKGRWLAWSIAGGGVLVALLLAILYRQGRRSTKRLASAQDELLRIEKQREAERIRMNIARDIHDELGGSLSKIALLSDLVQQDAAGSASAERLRSIADHARQVRGSLNDVVWAADPSSDHAGALLQYMADRAHRLLDGTGVELGLDLHADLPDQLLGPSFKRDMALVVKEALNNALKHARPTKVQLRFHIGAGRFELAVADNGQGMGLGALDRGNGLENMRDRVSGHGGSFTIRPGSGGAGTVVEASGPLSV